MTRVYGIRGMNRLIGSIMFIGIKMFIDVFIICGDENDMCLWD